MKRKTLFGISLFLLYNTLFGQTVVQTFFSDSYSPKGATYCYGGTTSAAIQKDEDKQRGKVLKLQFDDRTYSGIQVALAPGKDIDLSTIHKTGAIRFKIRGLSGNELFYLGLLDNGTNGINKLEVRCRNDLVFDVKKGWTEVEFPLSLFYDQGERYYQEQKCASFGLISWNAITSVSFYTSRDQNLKSSADRITTLFVDDIEIIPNTTKEVKARSIPWKLRTETFTGPAADGDTSRTIFPWFAKQFPEFTSVYTYNDPTDFNVENLNNPKSLPFIAAYLRDDDYSGITLNKGAGSIDLSNNLEYGGLEFMVRGGKGNEQFLIGLLDDESDGPDKKVQCKVRSSSYFKTSTSWQKVFIPFSDFGNNGKWWNPNKQAEIFAKIDWTKISEVRFSTDQYQNTALTDNEKSPVRLYFSDVKFVKKGSFVPNAKYWETFISNDPDRMICTFDNESDLARWKVNADSATKIKFGLYSRENSKAMRMDYKIASYGSATYTFDRKDTAKLDWSHHSGIGFEFFSSEKNQTCMVMIVDAGGEAWSCNFETKQGWQKIIVPFARFSRFEWWQPDNARIDGKLDLQTVYAIDFRPGGIGNPGSIMVENLMVTNAKSVEEIKSNKIRMNQIGFLPNAKKQFVIADSSEKAYSILDKNGQLVTSGTLNSFGLWKLSGEFVKTADISSITTPGSYTLLLQESGEKHPFDVNPNVYKNVYNAALKSYYYQRASIDLLPQCAGQWAHKKGHPDTSCQVRSVPGMENKSINVSGGWYDAGDYGKYIVNAGITVGTLLSLYELFPGFTGDSLSIPESHNGVSDLLDEARYELTWMTKMQDCDGGVFFKVGPLSWDPFVQPQDCKSQRFVIGKSTTSALDFSAVMAMASRVYKKIDSKFSNDCLKRSVDAWNWAQANPHVTEPSEIGGTGAYQDNNFDDEFFWAACELYTSTNKGEYKKQIQEMAKNIKVLNGATWQQVGNLGWYTLATHFKNDELKEASIARELICERADENLKSMSSNPYNIPDLSFEWGSNSNELNCAVLQCYAHLLSGKNKYLESATEVLDYIFGENAVGMSFVTGFGTQSPLQPHHRIMTSDNIDKPFPGFLVGGPNAGRNDEVTKEPGVYYPYKEPARAYVDRMAAYACNEISINWNAPLVFTLGYVLNTNR